MLPTSAGLFETPVISSEKISDSSLILRLAKFAEFKAGQVIYITTGKTLPPRMYSIASGEQDEFIDILLKIVPAGMLTPRLTALAANDLLWVSKPFGSFLGTPDPACMIATGTGLAPYLSMLKTGDVKNKLLLHGSRSISDFYYAGFLAEKLGKAYVQCYTGHDEWNSFRGRVTSYLESMDSVEASLKYYLCGSAEMIVEARQILIDRGIPFNNILSEIYF
jgi:ferredoxin--NADP+ reductase